MINSRQSFNAIRRFWLQIQRVKEREKPRGVLIGNKSDLVDERVVSFQEGEELAKELCVPFIETSVLKRENVDEMFQLLAHQSVENIGINLKGAKRT